MSAHVSETAQHVSETASTSSQQGREQIAHVGQSLEEHILDKPLQSVLMAAGLGMILALLWKKPTGTVCKPLNDPVRRSTPWIRQGEPRLY